MPIYNRKSRVYRDSGQSIPVDLGVEDAITRKVLTTGDVYYVHATAGAAGNDGTSPDYPLATIDQAINKCTASQNDTIMVMPGHAETISAAAGIDADIAGISIIGLGNGSNVPVITFGSDTAADMDIDAANIRVSNIRFVCNIASQTTMIDVNSSGAIIENCFFEEGTATGLSFVDVTGSGANACDDTIIRNNRFYAPTAGNYDRAIELGEVADGVRIEGNTIYGDFDDAGIHNPTGKVLTNLHLAGNVITNLQSGQHAIELVSACTGTAFGNLVVTDAQLTAFDAGALACAENYWNISTGGDSEGVPVNQQADSATNYIGTDDSNNVVATTNVAANEDGSVLERLEQLQEAVNKGSGTALAANKSLADALGSDGNAVTDSAVSVLGAIGADNNNNAFASTNVAANEDGSVLERLEQLQEAVNKGSGTALAANKSLADALGSDGNAVTDSAVSVLGAVGADNNNNAFASTNVAANEDGSVLERLEQVQEAINKGSGTALGANRSILDEIRGSALNYNAVNYVGVTADLTSATWNTQASHEVFTVTGIVRLRVLVECTDNVAGGGSIQFGVEGATDALIASSTGTDIDTGELWYDATPTTAYDTFANVVFDRVINGLDVGYEITAAPLTGGSLVFHCWWEALNATGAVAAGAGGAL